MSGPCAKQLVRATIVTADGRRFVGENEVENPQEVCPRAGMATGEGYHLCLSVCEQPAHAEIRALVRALEVGPDTPIGAVLYLEGHTYLCKSCLNAVAYAGVKRVVFEAPP